MESRLKERLTGAAILVALIVLIVPEIFHDRRAAPTPPGIGTGAPTGANAVPTRSYTIELAPRPAATAPAGAGAQPVAGPRPAAEVRLPVHAKPAAEPTPAVEPKPAVEPRPVAEAARTAASAPAPRAAPEAAAKTRVANASSGSHGRAGGWTVQLGLFAKSANAERLAHTAQSHGFDVAISRFGPRGLYRVAVAGIADRAAAEQLSHRLKGAGLPAAILGPR